MSEVTTVEGYPRWHEAARKDVDNPRITALLREIIEVCRRAGFSLTHEDSGGAFVVRDRTSGDANDRWLMDAHDGTTLQETNDAPRGETEQPEADDHTESDPDLQAG